MIFVVFLLFADYCVTFVAYLLLVSKRNVTFVLVTIK